MALAGVSDVLSALSHESREDIPEVASNFSLYFVVSLNAFVQASLSICSFSGINNCICMDQADDHFNCLNIVCVRVSACVCVYSHLISIGR